MEASRLRELVHAAARKGICHKETLDAIQRGFDFEAGEVSRSSLLRTYERRLSRTAQGSDLREQTRDLVAFLGGFPDENLMMISIRPEAGGFYLFLADEEGTEILFWMRMFSQT
ncbi:hypothetical protein [Streptomyces narbonensis]|uniref:hypothetical protein n=1 Tax=Streptomyces narbonensis TaxID=67333 RepID=UPI001672E115|nr:hypothetical protein [Streptomyces narbonensis]GGW01840.1 hypothetical protein GCM10010230_33350 [Streptomyces narbonensis]